eukprot:g2408.t1
MASGVVSRIFRRPFSTGTYTVKELRSCAPGDTVEVRGWVRSVRNQKNVSFLEVNDGSSQGSLQVIAESENAREITDNLTTGCSVSVSGLLKNHPKRINELELVATDCTLLGNCHSSYPLQKKYQSLEFLRENMHLRSRTNTLGAVMRVRNAATQALHEYFQKEGYLQIHTPILTGNDCEGAGELFRVTSTEKSEDCTFFGDGKSGNTYLTVSGQLQAEIFASSLSRVYSFGPTFRAEQSNTSRHLAEFWMLEPEIAFADLCDLLDVIEGSLQYTLRKLLASPTIGKGISLGCADDLIFFENAQKRRLKQAAKGNSKRTKELEKQQNLLQLLQQTCEKNFARMTYTEAIDVLTAAVVDGKATFEHKIEWGLNLQSEHERYLAEKYCCGPVFVTDYPAKIKPFYMRKNDIIENERETVAAVDLLVPRLGELVGGSQREERIEVLEPLMMEHGLLPDLEWYADLRRYGSVPHSGFGLGFERLLLYLTGLENIRDVIAIPRYPGFNQF